MIAKYGIELLKDNKTPFLMRCTYHNLNKYDIDDVVPEIIGVQDQSAIKAVERHFRDGRRNAPEWKFKDKRHRQTKLILEEFNRIKRDEYRAWKRFANQSTDQTLNAWGVQFNLTLDQVIIEIAKSMSLTAYDLRKRSKKFIEGLVEEYLEAKGIPKEEDYFELKQGRNVLMTERETENGYLAADCKPFLIPQITHLGTQY